MAEEKNTDTAVAPDPNEGPGKGKAFFDRARTVAATGNFDYAIEMAIQGLNREPFNVAEHQALREVSMRRKIAGGKSGGGLLGALGGGVKMPFKGKTPKEAMLNNEFTLSRDVGNITAMLAIIRNADLLNLREVVLWMGTLLKEANRTNKSPKVEIYTELGSIYAKYEEYERACDVINEAAKLKPQDTELQALSNQYAAQATIRRGQYDKGESFKKSIKDVEGTKKLLEEDNLGKSEEYRKKSVEEARAAYEKNPMELQVISKYYKALWEMDDDHYDEIAIQMLLKAYQATKIYRLKAAVGDIRMRQFKKNLRLLREAVKSDPSDKDMVHQYHALDKERLAFELGEFKERAEHMPTDMMVKYELGVRYYESKHFDEAIGAFQEAQVNPKIRVEALHLLGRSFLTQNMKPEAVETLKRSIEEYELAPTGNAKSQDLHYWYARALQENNQFTEAMDIYSRIVRWNMQYLDARKRLNDLREQKPPEGPA
jgi:tetratricopeptide (TPR) repeat protein